MRQEIRVLALSNVQLKDCQLLLHKSGDLPSSSVFHVDGQRWRQSHVNREQRGNGTVGVPGPREAGGEGEEGGCRGRSGGSGGVRMEMRGNLLTASQKLI